MRLTNRLALTATAMTAADRAMRKTTVSDAEAAAEQDSVGSGSTFDFAGDLGSLQDELSQPEESFDIVSIAELMCCPEEVLPSGAGT